MSWRQLLAVFQPLTWLTGAWHDEPPKRPPTFMNLPTEIHCAILHLLPFEDAITMATVCTELRVLALCECALWTELPLTTLDSFEKLVPFLHRAGKLGTALWIDGIEQHRLAYLAKVLDSAVPALRSLGLHFYPAEQVDTGAMAQVLYAIAKSAPLLEHLELAAPDHLHPLSALPSQTLGLMPIPRHETSRDAGDCL